MEAAVDGCGMDFAGEVHEGEAAVGRIGMDRAIEVGELDAAVFRAQIGGEVAWDAETIADRPTAVGPAGEVWALGLDGAVGDDLYLVKGGLGVLAA